MCCILTFVGHVDVELWIIWQIGGSTDCGEKIPLTSVWTLRKNRVHARPWWSGIHSGINKRCISSTTSFNPPPTADAFKQHVLREMYQTVAWHHSRLPEALSSWSPYVEKKKKKRPGSQIDVVKKSICSTRPQRHLAVQLRDLRWSRNWIGIDARCVLPKHDTFCRSIMWMSEHKPVLQYMSTCALPAV